MIIVVIGPTGIGKTKLSLALAKHYNTEIISGDSVQVYKGLDIGSSSIKVVSALKKPGQEDLEILFRIQEPSFGVRKGVVIDVDKVAELITLCLRKTEDSLGQKIKTLSGGEKRAARQSCCHCVSSGKSHSRSVWETDLCGPLRKHQRRAGQHRHHSAGD